ncbi:hypothetical protein Tco_1129687, partial [Tanacetum coccineum]
SAKQIMALNEEIANLNNHLSKEKSTVSRLEEDKKKLKSNFKTRKDELLDKQIELEKKIKELDNILQAQQKQQSLYNGKVLLDKHDPPVVYDSEETLKLAQESRLKMQKLNKEIKPENYEKINKLSKVFVSQKAKSREEVYFSNTSKMANVSTSFSIPNDEISDDASLSVARKFLNEVKDTLVTLQHVVTHRKNGNVINLSSSTHQEIHKIFKDKIVPIVNQVDARIQNFENHFVKEAAKFVRDFKSLAKEAEDSLNKIKVLEKENDFLLRVVVKKVESCIIKKEKEYATLWNDWYKKCEECKYDKISYDKAHKDMQQQIERLQAQLGDLKVSEQKDTTKVTSVNTQFRKQSILGKPPSSSGSNSIMINPFKASRANIFMPNKHVKASVRTKPITVSQPHVIIKKDVNSNTTGFSPKDVEITTRTRRAQPRINPKNDKVPSKSKSSCLSSNLEKIKENNRNLQSSSN